MSTALPTPEFSTRRATGAVVLTGVDGRSLMARRFRDIVTGIGADLGGDLTEAQKHLLARAATLAVWAEAARDRTCHRWPLRRGAIRDDIERNAPSADRSGGGAPRPRHIAKPFSLHRREGKSRWLTGVRCLSRSGPARCCMSGAMALRLRKYR